MSSRLLHTTLAAAGHAAALVAPTAALARTDISLEQRTAPVSSYAGDLAWSHYDAATDRYQLMIQRPGLAPAPAPVPDAREPFDVNLGGSRSGAPTAVYARCATPGAQPGAKDSNPLPGTGCDVYRYRIGAPAEEHLTQISAPSADERQPTISRGQIAFIRRERGAHGITYDAIRLGDTTRANAPTKVLVKVDIRKQTLADASLAFGPRLPRGSVAYVLIDRGRPDFGRKRLRVLDLNATSSVNAYTATSGGANFADVTRPSWDPFRGLLYFARTNTGSGQGNRFVRWSHATRRLTYAQGSPRTDATSWISPAQGMLVGEAITDNACLGNINDTPDKSQCRIYTTGPLSSTAGP